MLQSVSVLTGNLERLSVSDMIPHAHSLPQQDKPTSPTTPAKSDTNIGKYEYACINNTNMHTIMHDVYNNFKKCPISWFHVHFEFVIVG